MNELSVTSLIQQPFLRIEANIHRSSVANTFGSWINVQDCEDFALALYPFTEIRPLCYIDWNSFERALEFFERNVNQTLTAMATQDQLISHAIQSLLRPGNSWGRENHLSTREPSELMLFEQVWHPEYQRYAEHIYNHLIRLPLEILGQAKGKDYQSPTLANRVSILNSNGLSELTQGYNPIVRNAISHGSTVYEELQIRYIDRDKERNLYSRDFAVLFDGLVDACNGMVAAILVFLCRNRAVVQQFGLQRLPLGVRFLLVKGLASYRGFQVDAMLESRMAQGKPQLNIHCTSFTRSRFMHLLDGTSVAIFAQTTGGKGYERFSISINCGLAIPASLFIRGQELAEALRPNAPLESLAKIYDTNLLWYDVSVLSRRFYVWKTIMSLAWAQAYQKLIADWRQIGFKVWRSRYLIREVKNKSVAGIRRVEAEIVLTEDRPVTPALIHGVLRHATRRLRRSAIPNIDIAGPGRIRSLPAYVWIRLHKSDARVRTLESRGWKDLELLARSEWIWWMRRRSPIFVHKPDTIYRGIRIEYNPELKQAGPL